MGDEVKENEKRLETLRSKRELETEKQDHELSKEQKKAEIRKLKKEYGRDWKKVFFGAAGKVRINKETMQDLHGLGVGGEQLRDLNNPFGRSRSA